MISMRITLPTGFSDDNIVTVERRISSGKPSKRNLIRNEWLVWNTFKLWVQHPARRPKQHLQYRDLRRQKRGRRKEFWSKTQPCILQPCRLVQKVKLSRTTITRPSNFQVHLTMALRFPSETSRMRKHRTSQYCRPLRGVPKKRRKRKNPIPRSIMTSRYPLTTKRTFVTTKSRTESS